ncbi:MAG: ArsA family ATPase [Acidimicrobiia bacterium]
MVTTQLVFVTGKGGTGKSVVAAALAINRARMGQSVLAIDMGAAQGLGTHLRVPDLTYKPTEVRPGLSALAIDRSSALDEYLKLQLHLPTGAPTKQLASALSVLADTAPGVREIISVGKPIHETWKGTWDTVVVDAQALGQFQSYVQAPATIAELVPTGNVRRQAETLKATLVDPDVTSVIIVANPTELSVNESNEAIATLEAEEACPSPTVIMNRWLDPSGLMGRDLDDLPTGSVRDAAVLQVTMERDQESWASMVAHEHKLPFLRGVLTPSEVASQLADRLRVTT